MIKKPQQFVIFTFPSHSIYLFMYLGDIGIFKYGISRIYPT